MADGHNVSLLQNLRWYLGTDEVDRDAAMVTAGGPLALLGRADDDVVAFADRLAPERPVLDLLDGQRPTAPELKRLFAAHPDTVILAPRIGDVVDRIGLIVQPWYVAVTPLSRRADQAIALLRAAILDLGVTAPLEGIGQGAVDGLAAYDWPHGLRELRAVAWRLAAVLQAGSVRAAANALSMTRQSLSMYLERRIWRYER